MEKQISSKPWPMNIALSHYLPDLPIAVLYSQIYSAIVDGRNSYPVQRRLSLALYSDLETFLDRLALNLGWNTHRMNASEMLMNDEGLLVIVEGVRKSDYCSCIFRIWADSIDRAEMAKESILALAKDVQITSPMVSICWAFITAKDDLKKAYIEELVNDTLYDEAYPELEGGVAKFINDFLASSESILVLQGKPGTGKTRLIRSILGTMAAQKSTKVSALYTGDKKSMESDEIFVEFVTGEEEVFVVEDADYILKPRSEGNENLHRFLTIADGVVRSQGRKIIFSTNLPNLGDIDDALTRPGRCFARVLFREHTKSEAVKLLECLCGGNIQRAQIMAEQLAESDKNTYSLAEIYRQFEQSSRAESGEEVIRRVSGNVGQRIGF